MGRGKRGSLLGPLESEVMGVLWRAGTPVSVREVLAALNRRRDPPLAHTTVMTVLSRLAERGVVRRAADGRGYAYWAAVDSVAEIAVAQLLNLHGDAALVSFVDQVNSDERLRSRLRQLLEEEP